MAITSVQNSYGVRTASRDVGGMFGLPAIYKRLREHVWELTCDTVDGDGGQFNTGSEITITEDAVIVGCEVHSEYEFLTDPGATDLEVATSAVAMLGVTGGNHELMELLTVLKRYAVGVVTGLYEAKQRLQIQDWNLRWPIMDGDILKPHLSVFNDTTGTPTSVRHYGEVKFYVVERR